MELNKKAIQNWVKLEADKDCKWCGGTGISRSFIAAIPLVCKCIQKQITLDGEKSIADMLKNKGA